MHRLRETVENAVRIAHPRLSQEGEDELAGHVDPGVVVITQLGSGNAVADEDERRDVLAVHPRDDPRNPLTGVFGTRSQDRPNPIGLHRVQVVAIDELRLLVFPVCVGTGKRLFGDSEPPSGFTLVDSRTTAAGAVYSVLTPAPFQTGEVGVDDGSEKQQ